jgi:hypothetical protein
MSLRPKTKKKSKRRTREDTMFYDTPASQELAQIITIRSPREAAEAIKTITQMHAQSSQQEQIHIERAATLASNRTAAFVHSPEISPKEKKEMKLVSKRYRAAARKMRKERIEYERNVTKEEEYYLTHYDDGTLRNFDEKGRLIKRK